MSDLPKLDIQKLAQSSGLIVGNNNNSVLDFMSGQPIVFEGGYRGDLDKGALPGIDINEQRATRQTTGERLANAVPRMAGRFASEVAKMPGALVGTGTYLADYMMNGDEANFGEHINNGWVKFMEENISEKLNDKFQVYTPKAVQEGNLWDNITSSSFWANEGADGVGFLLSFLVPGGLLAKWGAVGKGANALGGLGRLAKAAKLSTTAAKNVELGAIASLNAVFEGAAEAAGAYEEITKHLTDLEYQKSQADPNYVPLTEEEIKIKAGQSTKGIFLSNLGILLGPNIFMAKAMFGSSKSRGIPKSLYEAAVDPKTKKALTDLPRLSTRQKAGKYLQGMGKGVFSEGFWEEGMQFSAERYFSNIAERDEQDDFNWLQRGILNTGGIFRTYMEELGNVDMQKGIFLGSAMGSPFGVVQAVGKVSAKEERDTGIIKAIRDRYTAFSGETDIYVKKTNDQGQEVLELDDNGNPVVDESKLIKTASEMQDIEDVLALKEASELAGDEPNRQLFLKELAGRFAVGYLNDRSGTGREFLKEHLNNVFEMNQTPAEDRAMIVQHVNDLEKIHRNSMSFADSLKFTVNIPTTTADSARGQLAAKLTMMDSRISGLQTARDIHVAKRTELELDPELDSENNPEYLESLSAIDSYDSVIKRLSDQKKELKAMKPDDILRKMATDNLLEMSRNWVKNSQVSKVLDRAMDETIAKGSQNIKNDPDLSEEDKIKLSEEYDKLSKESKDIKNTLDTTKDVDLKTLDSSVERIRQIYARLKEIGKISEEDHKKSMDALTDYYNQFKGRISASGLETANNPLFKDISYLSSVYHRKSDEGLAMEQRLNELVKTIPEAQLLPNLTIRVRKNEYGKKTRPADGNPNFEVVSPEFEYQVYYKDEHVGNIPEVTMYRTVTGSYLYDLAFDDKMSEDKLREITGIKNLDKALLKKTMLAQMNLMSKTKELTKDLKDGAFATIPYSDLDITVKSGRYSVVSKQENPTLPTVEDIVNNFPEGTEFVLVNAYTDKSTKKIGLTSKYLRTDKKKRDVNYILKVNKEAENIVRNTRGTTGNQNDPSKSLGSYMLVVKDPAGKLSVVAVKSPVLADNKRNALFKSIEKTVKQIRSKNLSSEKDDQGRPRIIDNDPVISKVGNTITRLSDFNKKIKETMFLSSPDAMSELELEVTPWGTVQFIYSRYVQAKDGFITTKRNIEVKEGQTMLQALSEAALDMSKGAGSIVSKESSNFLSEGIMTGQVIRQAYPSKEINNINLSLIKGFITSTSAEVREGRGLKVEYKGKGAEIKSPVPKKGGVRNDVSEKEYEGAVSYISVMAKFAGVEFREYVSMILEGKSPKGYEKAKAFVDIIERYESQDQSDNETYLENKKAIEEYKKNNVDKDGKNKLVEYSLDSNKYTDGKKDSTGVFVNLWNRVTSLFPDHTIPKDGRHKYRGTIVDDLLRKFIDGEITTKEQLVKSYQGHEHKLDTFAFSDNSLAELFDIFIKVKDLAESNDLDLITNVPPFTGKLTVKDKEGKVVEHEKVAGTIDVLGISRKDGKVYIIDLKSSIYNRREQYKIGKYIESDAFQQNAYAELMLQSTGVEASNILIFPIELMMDADGNTVNHFVANKNDDSTSKDFGMFTMRVPRESKYLSKKTDIKGLNERLISLGLIKPKLPVEFTSAPRPKGRLNAFKSNIISAFENLQILKDINWSEFDFLSESDKKNLNDLKPIAEQFSKLNMLISGQETRTVEIEKDYVRLNNELINKLIDILNPHVKTQLGLDLKVSDKKGKGTDLDSLLKKKVDISFSTWKGETVTQQLHDVAQAFLDATGIVAQADQVASDLKMQRSQVQRLRKIATEVVNGFEGNPQGPAPFKLTDNPGKGERVDTVKIRKSLRRILPSHINTVFVDRFTETFSAMGNALGYYMDNVITLLTMNEPGVEYHESFHGVFRSVMTDDQIAFILSEARNEYSKPTLGELVEFGRRRNIMHYDMDTREILWYEEKLADSFQKFMLRRNDPNPFKRVWNRLYDWINALFNGRTEIEKLFRNISKGEFVRAGPVDNVFTGIENNLGINPVYKLITSGRDRSGIKKLNAVDSENLVNTLTYFTFDRLSKTKGLTTDKALENVIEDLKTLYDTVSYIERLEAQDNVALLDSVDIYRMESLYNALNNTDGYFELIEAAKYRLALYDLKEAMSDEVLENMEDDEGLRSFSQNTENIGGFGSLSKWLRKYIGFTVKQQKDEFGNEYLKEGVPMIVPLDVNKVYNGILRAVSNQPNEDSFVERLRLYAEENHDSGEFIRKFFEDVDIQENNRPGKNFHIFQQVVKQMNQYKLNYKFVRVDPNRPDLNTTKVSNANMHDVDTVQVGQWNNSFVNASSQSKIDNFRFNLQNAITVFNNLDTVVTLKDLDDDVNAIWDFLNKDNILSLSKGYIRFSVYSNLPEDSEMLKNEKVIKYLETFSEVKPIDHTVDLAYMVKEIKDHNRSPFQEHTKKKVSADTEVVSSEDDVNGIDTFDQEDEGGDEIDKRSGSVRNAKKLALANSVFDETVGSTSFQNAEGETVYAHQLPTYHLVAIAQLRNSEEIDKLMADPFLANNRIVKDAVVREAFMNGEFFRLDGIRSEETDIAGKLNSFRDQKKGVTYKKMTPREFLLSTLSLAYKERVRTEKSGIAMQPSLIRVLEASSTADFMSLPYISDSYLNSKTEDRVRESIRKVFIDRMESEFNRITRVKREIDEFNESGGKIRPKEGIIKGYHTGKDLPVKGEILFSDETDNSGFRGLKFDKVDKLLSDEMKTRFINAAKEGKNFREMISRIEKKDKQSVYTDLGNSLDRMFHDSLDAEFMLFMDLLESEGILGTDKDGKVDSMLPKEIFNTEGSDYISELGKIFFTDWVNTITLNEVLLSDEAMGLKDAVNAIKRAKGSNASGNSSYHTGTKRLAPFENLPMTVIKEPVNITKFGKTDVADGQGWVTVNAWKNVMHGLGKMTKEAEEFFDKVENGTVTDSDVFGELNTPGSISGKFQMNSLKLVYYDGKRYIKLSVVPLTKQFTSIPKYENDRIVGWEAIPGMETLHKLREDMEKQPGGIAMSIPETASKMMTADVADFENGESLIYHNTDTKFWRLQLENPSNKKEIRDPSQILHLIDSEIIEKAELKKKYDQIVSEYRKNSSLVRKNNFSQTTKSIFTKNNVAKELDESIDSGQITPKLADFLKHAVETLQASGAEARVIQYFSPDPSGGYIFNLNSHVTLAKFSELFINYFSEGSLGNKLPGYSVALMSGFGVNILQGPNGEIVSKEKYLADRNSYSVDEDIEGKTKLTTRRLQHNRFDEKRGIYYSEVLMPAHYREFLTLNKDGTIPDDLAYMFGVRIPSQDKHSAMNLKVVGFMPSYMGSTAIFPDELINLSGADFDIDKMYIHRPAHYVSYDGSVKRFGSETDRDGKWREFILWKTTSDKKFARKYKTILREYYQNPELVGDELSGTIEMINLLSEELESVREELSETDVAKNLLTGAQLTDEDWKTYRRLSEKYQGDPLGARKKLFETLKDKKEFKKELKSMVQVHAYMETLRYFDLPTSTEKLENYTKKHGEPNNGVLYNKILDAKMQLYSAPSLETARNSPATMKALLEITEDKQIGKLLKAIQYKNTDNLFAKAKAYTNNREGGQNIGPAVNSNLAFNVLAKAGATLTKKGKPSIGLKTSKKNKTEFIPSGLKYVANKVRVNDIHSAVTSAMTDNASVLLAPKLGLSFEAIGVFGYMISVGYSTKDAIVIINQPLVKEYLKGLRTRKSSVTVKEEDQNKIYSYEDAVSATKLNLKGNPTDSERTDISVEEMIKDLTAFTIDPKGELSQHIQYGALKLFTELEEHARHFQHLNRIIKLVKGISSDFESMDAVFEAYDSFTDPDNAIFEVPVGKETLPASHIIDSNPVLRENLDILRKMDRLMSKVFVERTEAFKNAYRNVIAVHKNPDRMKDAEKKKIKLDLLSYMYLNAYKQIRKEKPGLATFSLSNSLLFDQTNAQLREKVREDLKKQNIPLSESILDERFPTITDLYRKARAAYEKIAELKGKPELARNAFLDYIVSSEPGGNKKYHSLEARNRVKENPVYMEKVMNSFEEMMFISSDPTEEVQKLKQDIQQFAIAAVHYLMVHDGFQYRNKSFINLIPPDFMKTYSGARFPGSSAIERVQKNLNDPGSSEFKNNVGMSYIRMIQRFMHLFSIHPDNGFSLFWLNPKSEGWKKAKGFANKSKPDQKMVTVNEKANTITFNRFNQPEITKENESKLRIGTLSSILGIREWLSEKKTPYMAFRYSFRLDKDIYTLSSISWGKDDVAPSKVKDFFRDGYYNAPIATYVKTSQKGHRGVKNTADVDKGDPTNGQPLTDNFYTSKKKKSYFFGQQQDDDVLFWNSGAEDFQQDSEREVTPENITSLKSNEVFVFGANTAGGHGGGTAGLAQRGTASSNYTALPIGTKGKWSEYGVVDKLMQGTEGKSFGIVTKSATISGTSLKIGSKRSVPLSRIEESINKLIETANNNPDLKFLVTKFGTNMAGFTIEEIKGLLQKKTLPDNIILPKEFEFRSTSSEQPGTDISSIVQGKPKISKGLNMMQTMYMDRVEQGWTKEQLIPVLAVNLSFMDTLIAEKSQEEIEGYLSDAGMDVISDIEKAKAHVIRKIC